MASLAIITVREELTQSECELARYIFGPTITVNGYTVARDNTETLDLKEDLVLVVGPIALARHFASCLPAGKDYVIKRRILDPATLHLIFQIPENTDVLLVSDTYINACELIHLLEDLNLHPLRYFAYNPQYTWAEDILRPGSADASRHLSSFSYAITSGYSALVPKHILKIVDIGMRKISMMTVVDILRRLVKNDSLDEQVTMRYMKSIVELNVCLAQKNQQNLFLQEQLTSIIANMQNGILVVDEHNNIIICNESAKEIIGTQQLEGANLRNIFPGHHPENFMDREFLQLQNSTVHVNTVKISNPLDKAIRYLIHLDPLEQIRDIDNRYRKQAGKEHRAKYEFRDILYYCNAMKETIDRAKVFARSDSSIMITGESGTGKELLAQAIHNGSQRRKAPFVAINCGALTESLLESELFGYEDGAFTGAKKGGKCGLFEIAHGGTVFLDEIGDMSVNIQVKLLRALQERVILRLGGHRLIPVDVRIIAATNKNLQELQQKGQFRKDLYYRLHVLPLALPALRQRPEDIVPLFRHLLNITAQKERIEPKEISPGIIALLEQHTWPGNVREMQNIVNFYLYMGILSDDIQEDLSALLETERNESTSEANRLQNNPSPKKPACQSYPVHFPSNAAKEESYAIMRILQKAGRQKTLFVGRSDLQQQLQSDFGLSLSFIQIKRRLDQLRTFGLVGAKKGKGHHLLPAGNDYLMEQKD